MSLKSILIKPAVNTEETGSAFPAAIFNEFCIGNNQTFEKTFRSHEKISSECSLTFSLANTSKFTDLLSQAAINSSGLMISENLYKILKDFDSIPFQGIPTIINGPSSSENYIWIHFIWETWMEVVDWSASTFRIFENGKFDEIEINSYEEYLNEVNKTSFFRIAPLKPKLKEISFDLYNHPFLGENRVSERFAQKLIERQLTGIDLISNPQVN